MLPDPRNLAVGVLEYIEAERCRLCFQVLNHLNRWSRTFPGRIDIHLLLPHSLESQCVASPDAHPRRWQDQLASSQQPTLPKFLRTRPWRDSHQWFLEKVGKCGELIGGNHEQDAALAVRVRNRAMIPVVSQFENRRGINTWLIIIFSYVINYIIVQSAKCVGQLTNIVGYMFAHRSCPLKLLPALYSRRRITPPVTRA